MFFIEFTANILKINGIKRNNFSKKISLNLLRKLFIRIPIKKSTFFTTMRMKITIKKYLFFLAILIY